MTSPWQDILSTSEFKNTPVGEPADFPALCQRNTVTPLQDRGVLRIHGPDTDKLLQGQLTCDITNLENGNAIPGALCDVKGRMITSFFAYRPQRDHILLLMHSGLLQSTLATLKKYAVFYKTEVTDDTANIVAFGINHPNGGLDTHEGTIAVNNNRSIYLCTVRDATSMWQKLNANCQPAALSFWEYLSIRDGLGEVRPETSEEFIPQMLNFQHTGAVNFRKGCYTGQEIVARMQYLGKLKRRMYRLRLEGQRSWGPGTAIHLEANRNIGTVVMSQSFGGVQEMLAVLTREAASGSTLVLNDSVAAFEVLPLPYDDNFATTAP
jgi:tRNA-modifying protein YgfZ